MSIWSFIKNLLWTCMDFLFAKNEPLNHAFIHSKILQGLMEEDNFWNKLGFD
jgi:hypothetical protein